MINHTKKCYTDYTSIPNFKTPLLEMVYYWVYNIISHNQPHSLVWRFWPPMIAASSLKMPFEVDSSTFSCWWIHPLSIVKSGQPKINPAYCTTIHQLEIKCQRIGCRENQNRKLPLFFWHMGGGPANAPSSHSIFQRWPKTDAIYDVPWARYGPQGTLTYHMCSIMTSICLKGFSPIHLVSWMIFYPRCCYLNFHIS